MTVTEIKRIVKKEVEILDHVCYHEEKIKDMHKILVGNGDPDHCVVAQLIRLEERQTKIFDKLEEIQQSRKSLLPTILNLIAGISALCFMYFGYKDLKNQGSEIKTETKVTNELLYPSQSRGALYEPIIKDSINDK